MIALRVTNPALKSDNIEFFHENPDAKVLAYLRWSDTGARVVVVLNFSDQNFSEYKLTHFPDGDSWHDLMADFKVATNSEDAHVLITELKPYEAKVFIG